MAKQTFREWVATEQQMDLPAVHSFLTLQFDTTAGLAVIEGLINDYFAYLAEPEAPTSLPLDPADVVVVINSGDPASASRAAQYHAAWGTTRQVTLNLGASHDVSSTVLNAEKSKLDSIQCRAFALCFDYPSRVNGNNSITSAIAHGYNTNFSATANPDNAKWAVMVPGSAIERAKAATGSKPKGTIYVLLANDGGGAFDPRGDARAPQVSASALSALRLMLPAGVNIEVIDNRNGCPGECDGNFLMNKHDVLAYFGSMYKLRSWNTNTMRPGAYADHLTSLSGLLPSAGDQFPITDFLVSACASSGTVMEPWMNDSVTTAKQFVHVGKFCEQYFVHGKSYAESWYRSVERPWRTLCMGDPLMAPYANAGVVDPPVDPPVDPNAWIPVDFSKLQKGAHGDFQTVTATKINHNGSSTANRVCAIEAKELSFDITVHALVGYRMILNDGPDGIYLNPQGYLTDRNGRNLRDTPLKIGEKTSVTITYSTPQKFTRIGAIDEQGNCFRAVIENMKYR